MVNLICIAFIVVLFGVGIPLFFKLDEIARQNLHDLYMNDFYIGQKNEDVPVFKETEDKDE